jgi:LuxR family maltose regulon positive regulatory protein
MIPAKVKRQRPSLLMTDGWVAYCRLQLERIPVLIQQCEAWRFTCQIIEIAVLQALALEKRGRADGALEALKDAVALAEPGGWIRPFVEAGEPMVDLIMRLRQQNESVDYIERLLAALPDTASKPPLFAH